MLLRFALFAALIATPAYAAPVRKAPPKPVVAKEVPPQPLHDTETVVMTTDLGTITLELDGKHAPISTANFMRYVDNKRFDGVVFYRAMHLKWGEQPNGLIQAGTRGDPRKTFPPIAHEPTNQTGVLHKAGAISLARLAPGTATGDFSILLSDIDGLDANPQSTDPEAQAGYAAFGHVVSGMDVVRKIWDQPVDPEAGEGFMKGQMLAQPVKVISVRRVVAP
ncbi:peptidylprolyl isomerase [Novosphingobium sediminicola]|uniref:peptidylprolyl isomerase n=1 Tax=Novosphingobium sediminicola TaxID=563162 RepID=A0A7W6CIA8_9SPHN|nr:peptidylprolyl isomerase [Novosphingobium sediminicola]MBB3955965.1 peptidyl-prolyl cis-trans isomerase A (cyclophilin A) [Novosphingobium sediminicola]